MGPTVCLLLLSPWCCVIQDTVSGWVGCVSCGLWWLDTSPRCSTLGSGGGLSHSGWAVVQYGGPQQRGEAQKYYNFSYHFIHLCLACSCIHRKLIFHNIKMNFGILFVHFYFEMDFLGSDTIWCSWWKCWGAPGGVITETSQSEKVFVFMWYYIHVLYVI